MSDIKVRSSSDSKGRSSRALPPHVWHMLLIPLIHPETWFELLRRPLHNSTEESPSWKADTSSVSQAIPRISRNSRVRHRVSKRLQLVPSPGPGQYSPRPQHHHPTSWKSILILSTHLRLGLPSGFPTKTPYPTLLLSPTRVTCSNHSFFLRSPAQYSGNSTDHRVKTDKPTRCN